MGGTFKSQISLLVEHRRPAQKRPAEPQADPGDANVGARVGNFRLVRRLDQGGIGQIYLARHVYLDRPVAIKLLHEGFARDAAALERFVEEALAASAVDHPNIVQVLDFGQAPAGVSGGTYLLMEYIEDSLNLARLLESEGPLPAYRAISILGQVARALAAVHARRIVHGDIKPDNVLIQKRPGQRRLERAVVDAYGRESIATRPEGFFDFVKVCDFGTACLLHSGTAGGGDCIMGTPPYMAPEVARGEPYDHRADIYALGVLFFEMLTGQVPFTGDTIREVLEGHIFKPVPDPRAAAPGCDCTAAAARLIRRAMAKRPEERFQTAADLGRELEGCYGAVRYSTPSPDVAPVRTKLRDGGRGETS